MVQKVTVGKGGNLTGSVNMEPCKEFVLHSIDPHGVGIGRPAQITLQYSKMERTLEKYAARRAARLNLERFDPV